jgi:hypothetical protein
MPLPTTLVTGTISHLRAETWSIGAGSKISVIVLITLTITILSLSSSISNFGVAIHALETTASTCGSVATLIANSSPTLSESSRFPILRPLYADWWWLRCLPGQLSLWVKSGQQWWLWRRSDGRNDKLPTFLVL